MMLTLIQLRWGNDQQGHSDRPLPVQSCVEAMVRDEWGHYYFVTNSRFEHYDKITVTPFSQFDIMINLSSHSCDFDFEWSKLERTFIEEFDFDSSEAYKRELLDDFNSSKFESAISFVRLALDIYLKSNDDKAMTKYETEYIYKDLDAMMSLNTMGLMMPKYLEC